MEYSGWSEELLALAAALTEDDELMTELVDNEQDNRLGENVSDPVVSVSFSMADLDGSYPEVDSDIARDDDPLDMDTTYM